MKEDFSAINRTLNVDGDYIFEVSYDNCIPYPNVLEIERKERTNKLYETVKRKRLQLAIEKYEIKDYIKKPELRVIEHTPRSRYNWEQDYKKKDTTKDRPVPVINREDLGYMKPGSIDKVNQTKFIF
jgi:cellobiose-specific phosphotransferase system component IIB